MEHKRSVCYRKPEKFSQTRLIRRGRKIGDLYCAPHLVVIVSYNTEQFDWQIMKRIDQSDYALQRTTLGF